MWNSFNIGLDADVPILDSVQTLVLSGFERGTSNWEMRSIISENP